MECDSAKWQVPENEVPKSKSTEVALHCLEDDKYHIELIQEQSHLAKIKLPNGET